MEVILRILHLPNWHLRVIYLLIHFLFKKWLWAHQIFDFPQSIGIFKEVYNHIKPIVQFLEIKRWYRGESGEIIKL